jgi:activator of 2-hydroxyglutaryl-CoA dehydratase
MALQYGAYIAMAGIGLYAIFVGEIISIFHFMSEQTQTFETFEPESKILQFISIGVAPAVIMSGTSYLIARRFGSKQIGWLVIAGGIVLLVGMSYAYTMLDSIDKDYQVFTVIITPPLFIVVSIPVMIVGALLFKTKKRLKRYF